MRRSRQALLNAGGPEEGHGALLPLIGQDLREGQARGVVDGDVDKLPADATRLALSATVAGDAMADAVEAAELLDVDVDQLAGRLPLVAAHGLGGIEVAQAADAVLVDVHISGCPPTRVALLKGLLAPVQQ